MYACTLAISYCMMYVYSSFCRDAADKVMSGKGKFEQLIVSSKEIAARTAQLVQ